MKAGRLISAVLKQALEKVKFDMGIIEKLKRVRVKRPPRVLTVKSAFFLTANMRRVTLAGDELANFPASSAGAHIKLLFDQNPPDESESRKSGMGKPAMRTYTIAQQRSAANEIDIDFMLHESNNGFTNALAAPWAFAAKPGDTISIFGPGLASYINLDADHFLLAADMTALPALTVSLQTLPDNAKGSVFIEILSEEDQQTLLHPAGVEIVWVVNDDPGSDAAPLYHAIQRADWPVGRVAAWVACEFKTMKKIRSYLKGERGLEKSQLYISSYWKRGDTEEQHILAKQADSSS